MAEANYNGMTVFSVESVFSVRDPCSNTKSRHRQLRENRCMTFPIIGSNSQDKCIFVRLAWRKDAFMLKMLD